MIISFRALFSILILLLTAPTVAFSQVNGPVLSVADYQQAERMLPYNTSQLVDRSSVKPNWLPGDRFWYRVLTAQGSEFVLLILHVVSGFLRLTSQKWLQLFPFLNQAFQPGLLPFSNINYSTDAKSIFITAGGKNWKYDLATGAIVTNDTALLRPVSKPKPNSVVSPDGRLEAFISDYNLWVREVATNRERQLTFDGIKDFGYATDNAGWKRSDNPIIAWSPDSKKIATYQQDQRNVCDMYLVTTNVGKPKLEAWKYPLPGDKDIATIHRVIINVDNGNIIRLRLPPDPHRGTLCDDISCQGNVFGDVEWSSDASRLAFVSTSRDHKNETVWIADAATGEVRLVFQENVATQFESGQGSANWRFLAASNEIIWYSERDNWGHLYLYDAKTGKLKNQITKGDWTISKLVRVDEKNRILYFLAGGREQGRNPYFSHFYKIRFDGNGLTLLTPEDGNHQVSLSPSGNYFIDNYSKQDVPPTIVLRNMDGKLVTIT